MQRSPTVLFVFAHPDDESFLAAATMAALVEQGSRIVICSATRGEEGEIAEGVDATRETLGVVREAELRAAMAEVGVTDVRFLGYRDSGMDGTDTNNAKGAFMRVPAEEAGRKVLEVIDEVQPDLLIGFGPEGVYLHPDHVAAHRAIRSAVEQAATGEGHHRVSAMLYASVPREHFLELWDIEGNPFADIPFETVLALGTPIADITHCVDGERFRDVVLNALGRHASQFGTGDPFDWLPPHLGKSMLRYNYYRLARLPWIAPSELPELFEPLG